MADSSNNTPLDDATSGCFDVFVIWILVGFGGVFGVYKLLT